MTVETVFSKERADIAVEVDGVGGRTVPRKHGRHQQYKRDTTTGPAWDMAGEGGHGWC